MKHRAWTDCQLLGLPWYLATLPFYLAANRHEIRDRTNRRLAYRQQIAAHRKGPS